MAQSVKAPTLGLLTCSFCKSKLSCSVSWLSPASPATSTFAWTRSTNGAQKECQLTSQVFNVAQLIWGKFQSCNYNQCIYRRFKCLYTFIILYHIHHNHHMHYFFQQFAPPHDQVSGTGIFSRMICGSCHQLEPAIACPMSSKSAFSSQSFCLCDTPQPRNA